jgi:type VI secretion system protein ImpJ
MSAKGPQRVVWSEGLLIGPQHLQQLDLYHERLLGMRLEAVETLHWGVVAVEFDPAALLSGQIKMQRLHVVLPDGAVLALDPGDPELPASRQVDGHFPHGQAALEVFIGLPREREGIDNYAEGRDGAGRYRIALREVRDASAPERRSEVAFGQRNARLLFGDEPQADYVVLKLAEIGRDSAGQLVWLDAYVPSCLRVAASPFLLAGMRRLLEAMTNRRRALNQGRRQSAQAGAVEWSAMDVTRYLLLSTINGFIPVLQHYLDSGDQAPRALYLALSEFAGQLSTFSSEADPTQLPKFAYRDLGGTFEELFARVISLLFATVSEHCVTVTLTPREDGMYVAQLSDERLRRCKRFLLTVQTDLPERQVAVQLPQFAKLAAWSEIQSIVRAATPGAPLEVNHRPPSEVPLRAGHVYFDIAVQNPYWRKVVQERELAVYLPPFFEPTSTQLALIAVMDRDNSQASERADASRS